jgi:tetratricopeptide (TPR) repeat protein
MLPKLVSLARSPTLPVAWGLFLVVLAVRLFCLFQLADSQFLIPQGGDMLFYNDWALRILHGQWTDHTAFYGLPLYAYLLAGIYKVFGFSPFIPGLIQSILEGGTAVIIYRLALLVFGCETSPSSPATTTASPGDSAKMIGVLAAIGWAFFQPAESYSIILMPTTWLVFVFWYLVWSVVRYRELPSLGRLLSYGLVVGITAMGIATILLLIPLLLLAILLRWKSTTSWRALGMAVLLGGVLLGASPAWIHNYFVAHDRVFLSAHSGVNFWIGNNPVATGYPKFPPGLHAGQEAMLKDSITTAEKAVGRSLKRSEVSAYWAQQGRGWIASHPLDWLKLVGVKIRNFWNAYQYDDLSIITAFGEEGMIVPGLGFGLIAALAIPGMLLALRRYPSSAWVVAAILLHMTSLLTVFVTERYRLAAVPGLLLFAAFGLWNLWRVLVDADYQRAGVFAGCLACGVIFVSWPQSDETLWSLDSYNSGLQALAAGRVAVAKQKLDLAYAYSPANAELNFAEGNLHLALGDRALARSYYLSALVLDQQHAGAFNNLGLIALTDHDPALAAKCFRHAIQIIPNDAKLHYLLAQADFASGQMKEAKTQIDAALELLPDRPEFKLLRAQIPSDQD